MRLLEFGGLLLSFAASLSLVGCGARATKENATAASDNTKSGSIGQAEAAEASPQSDAKSSPNTSVDKTRLAEAVKSAADTGPAVDNETRRPATAAEATAAIDLSTFPLMPGSKEPGKRVTATLGYDVA